MTVAESLVEFKRPERADFFKNGGEGKVGRETDEDHKEPYGGSGRGKPLTHKGKSSVEGDKKGDRKPLSCFLCEGPHRVRDYPQRAKLSAIIAREEEEQEGGRERLKLGTIVRSDAQLEWQSEMGRDSLKISAIVRSEAKSERRGKRKGKGLMYADMEVAGSKVEALVDTGATDLFIFD